MPETEIYTTPTCPFCHRAKADLDRLGIAYREIDISVDPQFGAEMIERSGRRTVPQIFIDGRHLGGSDDLRALETSGRLEEFFGAARERTA